MLLDKMIIGRCKDLIWLNWMMNIRQTRLARHQSRTLTTWSMLNLDKQAKVRFLSSISKLNRPPYYVSMASWQQSSGFGSHIWGCQLDVSIDRSTEIFFYCLSWRITPCNTYVDQDPSAFPVYLTPLIVFRRPTPCMIKLNFLIMQE